MPNKVITHAADDDVIASVGFDDEIAAQVAEAYVTVLAEQTPEPPTTTDRLIAGHTAYVAYLQGRGPTVAIKPEANWLIDEGYAETYREAQAAEGLAAYDKYYRQAIDIDGHNAVVQDRLQWIEARGYRRALSYLREEVPEWTKKEKAAGMYPKIRSALLATAARNANAQIHARLWRIAQAEQDAEDGRALLAFIDGLAAPYEDRVILRFQALQSAEYRKAHAR